MINVVVLVPAYNPDEALFKLVDGLRPFGFKQIIIINDGSKASCSTIFSSLTSARGVTVLNHEVNRGKGCAIKTGLKWYLRNYSQGCNGVVTADADGQHDPEDIVRVASLLGDERERLVLGVRNFNREDIPFKSSVGNRLTKGVFYLATGITTSDTQTGLRGIPDGLVVAYSELQGERYEYEMEMLLRAARSRGIVELKIRTIYEDGNKGSHFNPIVDSLKIYRILLKGGISRFLMYALASLCSFVIDMLIFTLLIKIILPSFTTSIIAGATVGARIASGIFNFVINRQMVFKSKSTLMHDALSYAGLAFLVMGASYAGVKALNALFSWDPIAAKFIVDPSIFVISFFIQRLLIFKRRGNAAYLEGQSNATQKL